MLWIPKSKLITIAVKPDYHLFISHLPLLSHNMMQYTALLHHRTVQRHLDVFPLARPLRSVITATHVFYHMSRLISALSRGWSTPMLVR